MLKSANQQSDSNSGLPLKFNDLIVPVVLKTGFTRSFTLKKGTGNSKVEESNGIP